MNAHPMLSSCPTSATKSAIAAFCIFHRRLPFSGRSHRTLSLSQNSNENESPPPSPDKDWFMDGREVARQLKLDLGIMSTEEDDETKLDSETESKFTASDAILESGRAAARELLQGMNDITIDSDNNEADDQTVGETPSESMESGRAAARELLKGMHENANGETSSDNEKKTTESLTSSSDVQTKSETPKKQSPKNQSSEDCFSLPSRKSHCMTVCFVPPPSASKAWEQLTASRKECKDPGFYRWPPHANIVYPFLEPVYEKDGGESKHIQRAKFRDDVAKYLAKVAEQCKPFDVTIDSFGTFGGKNRGVLWAYPKSKYYVPDGDDDDKEEPLIKLHSLLEEQFPMCKDQRKGGAFHPHMTISHYANNDDALAAKEVVESKWKPVSFHVPEIYLLERKGDDGQFKIAATIPLGDRSEVKFHDEPIPFPAMPEEEEGWVYDERMAMKNRRKQGNRRRRRRGGSSKRDDSQDSSKENN